jgi:hypothetical protein
VNLAEFLVANNSWLHAVAERNVGSMSNGRIVQQMRTNTSSGVSTVLSDTVSGMTREIGVDVLARGSVLVSRSTTAIGSLVSSSRAHDRGVQLA